MVSPVAGLRPVRALRLTSFNLPMPGNVKAPCLGARDGQFGQVSQEVGCLLLGEVVRFSNSCCDLRFCQRFVCHVINSGFCYLQRVVLHYWESVVRATSHSQAEKAKNQCFFRFMAIGACPWPSGASGKYRPDDISVDVGQAEVPTGVPIGELLMIDAKQMQDGRLKIVNGHQSSATSNQPRRWRRAPCHP